MDPLVAKYVRHILTENLRTQEAAQALANGDLVRMGQLMSQGEYIWREDDGCVVALVPEALVEEFRQTVAEEYEICNGI